MNEKEKGRQQHVNLVRVIKNAFPKASVHKQRYIQNKVARYINKFGNDNYGVVVAAEPISAGQYTNDTVLLISGTKVYISIQVD